MMSAMTVQHRPNPEQQAPCHGGVRLRGYLWAVLACAATAFGAKALPAWLAPANIDMLFLLAVFLVAWRLGRGPALLAAVLSVVLFDFFFVPPHFTLAVDNSQHLVTFVVMLAVALITGQLAAVAKERLHYAEVAQAARSQAEAERLRNSVLASLSHDLRTPLTALVGLADTLAQAGLPAPHDETARVLRDRSKDLAALVNNLLDLARLNGGSQPLRKEWQPLEEVVGTAIHLLEPALGGRPVRVELAEDLPLLEFDAVLLERVFGNLLDNAARHTPLGTAIRIMARCTGNEVEVAVSDAGPGFPAEGPKPGLGLTISRAIVEAHGGRLFLENALDGGARVAFTLPVGTPPEIGEETEPS